MVVVEGCSEKCRCDVVLGPALKAERGWWWWGHSRTEMRRQWVQLQGWVVAGRVLLCREWLGASAHFCSVEPLPPCAALPSHCRHISDPFWHQLKEFLQSSGQKVWEIRVGEVLICPWLPLLSWHRGRNGKKQQILPEAELVCPLYCYFAHSSLTFCKINWLSRIWVLFWASIFSASSAYSRMIGKLYLDKWQNRKVSALELFNLEKRMLWRDLIAPSST